MALAEATQEAIFLTQLFKDMTNSDLYDKFILYCDNQSAIALAKNAMVHQRSKHIDIKYHFVRSIISSGVMELVFIATEKNIADIFTKPIAGVKLKNFVAALTGM